MSLCPVVWKPFGAVLSPNQRKQLLFSQDPAPGAALASTSGFLEPCRLRWSCPAWLRMRREQSCAMCNVPSPGEAPSYASAQGHGPGLVVPQQEESSQWGGKDPSSAGPLAVVSSRVSGSQWTSESAVPAAEGSLVMFLASRIRDVLSVPAFGLVPFRSLGSRQGSRKDVGPVGTLVAWPEACSVPRSPTPLGSCKGRVAPWLSGRRFLFLWPNHRHPY